MKKIEQCLIASLFLIPQFGMAQGKVWTLNDCISYALEHNIQIKQKMVAQQQAEVDTKSSKASLLPSVSFGTDHTLSYRPFSETTTSLTGGTMSQTSNKTRYNGSYSISANWTVWDGGKNRKNIEYSKLSQEISQYDTQQSINDIQEQIAKIYVQILYEQEAVKVCQGTLDVAKEQEARGKELVEAGKMSRSELAQLTATVANDEYSLVNAQTMVQDYKMQLKQLLEIDNDIDITIPEISDEKAMVTLPAYQDVYNAALELRPEIKSNRLSIDAADMQISMAKSGYQPSVSLIANVGTSTATGIGTNWNTQFKNNLNNNIGVSISIPLYDHRQTKSSVEKAQLSKQSSELSLQSAQRQLHSTIEGYWLDAYSAQKKFIAAKASVESNQASFDLVNEQFKEGLKHLAELNTAKNNLLQSQQDKIQSKYTAVLNTVLLKFYGGESINF